MNGQPGSFSKTLVDPGDGVLAATSGYVGMRPVQYVECAEPGCWRPHYIEGRCKKHHDLHHYADTRKRERALHNGRMIWARARDGEWRAGIARSRAEALDPARPWSLSVLITVDGWTEPRWWPVDQVELRERGEVAA